MTETNNTNPTANAADAQSSAALVMANTLNSLSRHLDSISAYGKSVTEVLDAILQTVQVPSQDTISDIMELKKNERMQALQSLVCEAVIQAAKDDIYVERYSQRQRAQQHALVYTGTHWKLSDEQAMIDFFRYCAERMLIPSVYAHDHSFMNAVREQILFCLSRHQDKDEVDESTVLVNLQNGTLEVSSYGILFREHRRKDYLKFVLPYNYDPNATHCPLWTRFLGEVLPEHEAQQFLYEYIGYCLTRNLRLETHLVLTGPGGNGKSVVLSIITALLGSANCSFASLSSITNDANARLQLRDKRANISSEADAKKICTTTLKILASGDPVEVHQKYVDTFIMKHYAKLITSFNTLPAPEQSNAYWRRIRLVPFNYIVPADKKIIDLDKQICNSELPAILNLVLAALGRLLQTKRFTESPLCDHALRDYQLQFNSVLLWLTDRGYQPSATSCIPLSQLYASYKQFCQMDEDLKPVGKNREFQAVLRNFCGEPVIHHNQAYYNISIANE